MAEFVISTETTADLSEKLIREMRVEIIPMAYYMDGESFDGAEHKLSETEFYARMRDRKLPTTSMVNPDQAYLFFLPYLQQGKDVLHLSFSSALSGSYQSFRTAAERIRYFVYNCFDGVFGAVAGNHEGELFHKNSAFPFSIFLSILFENELVNQRGENAYEKDFALYDTAWLDPGLPGACGWLCYF